jgi:hypothetical protein
VNDDGPRTKAQPQWEVHNFSRENQKNNHQPNKFGLTFFIGSGEKWGVVAENVT